MKHAVKHIGGLPLCDRVRVWPTGAIARRRYSILNVTCPACLEARAQATKKGSPR